MPETETDNVIDLTKRRHSREDPDPGTVLIGELVDGPPDDDEDEDDDEYYPPLVIEHASYLAAGAFVVVRRSWRSFLLSDYTDQVQAATALGDQDRAAMWEEKREKRRSERHARFWDWIELPGRALLHWREIGIGCTALIVVPSVVYAVAERDATKINRPFLVVCDTAYGLWNLGITALPYATIAALVGGAVALWRVGMHAAEAGQIDWLPHLAIESSNDEPITPSIVVAALRDLGLSPLRKSIEAMGDGGAAMLSLIKPAGCGVEVDVTLPRGTSTKEIQDRRRKLAENMGRHEHEVFITRPVQARSVRLWIADSGALDEPIGPSPLATDPKPRANYKTGRAPVGQNLRSDPVGMSLHQRHLTITGLSNNGKTALLRALALWVAFDPRVKLRIADLKGAGDWAMFEGIADVLIQGPTDEKVAEATLMVEESVEEMERRLTEGFTEGVDDVWITIVDEAQVAFMCPAKDEHGIPFGGTKATSRYFNATRRLHNQGRAIDDLLWQGTQDPTDQNFPKIVREGAHTRLSLVVGTEAQARMALGDKAVDGGAAPHLLRQGLDKGTMVAFGDAVEMPPGESTLTIRSHYINDDDAWRIADLAKAHRGKAATRSGGLGARPETRSLLDDLDTVLSDRVGRIRLAHLPALLAELAPGYARYEGLTGEELKDFLDDHGIRWTKPGNVPQLDPVDFRDGLRALSTGSRGGR